MLSERSSELCQPPSRTLAAVQKGVFLTQVIGQKLLIKVDFLYLVIQRLMFLLFYDSTIPQSLASEKWSEHQQHCHPRELVRNIRSQALLKTHYTSTAF